MGQVMIKLGKDRKTYSLKKARLLLAALAVTSAFGMPAVAEAAVQTEPMVVTDKDKVIDDDFNITGNGHTYPTAIYVTPDSTGTVQVNSGVIHVENAGEKKEDTGIIDTGWGWKGILNLKDGMKISGKFTGTDVNAKGIELNGFKELTYETDTGKPYDGRANLGKDISIQVEANKATDFASLWGVEVDGENFHAGNCLSIEVDDHTGTWAENAGLKLAHYSKAQVGDNLSIHVINRIDGDSNHNLTDGIMTLHDFTNETDDSDARGRQALSIGNNAQITTEVQNSENHRVNSNDSEVMGIRLSHTDFSLGDGAILNTTGGAQLLGTYGINANYHTVAKIGNDLTNTVTVNGGERFVTGARVRNFGYAEDEDKGITASLTIGDRGKTIVSYTGDSNYNVTDGLVNDGGNFYLGNDNEIGVTVLNTGTNGTEAYGINVDQNGRVEAKNHFTNILNTSGILVNSIGLYDDSGVLSLGDYADNEVNAQGRAQNVMGYYITGKVKGTDDELSLGSHSLTSVKYDGDYQGNSHFVSGLWSVGSDTSVGDHASFTVRGNLKKPVSGAATQIRGVYIGSGSGKIGDNLTLHVSGHNYAMVSGIAASSGSTNSASIGDNAQITVNATEDETGTTNGLAAVGGNYIAGIKNWGKGSVVTVGKNARIEVTAPEDKDISAVWTSKNAETTLGDGAVLKLNSNSTNVNAAVMSQSGGKTVFTGGATVYGSKSAVESTGSGSDVAMTGSGRKVIVGDLLSEDSGTMDLKLDTGDSLLRGKSTVDAGTTDLTISNGARWDMTGSSTVTSLTHENGGIVNMEYSPSYQKLEVGNYRGRDGLFLMKTDLDSQTQGDKVHMVNAADGSQGKIRVEDRSFLTGNEVTGNRHLLLVTDDSQKAAFTGETLDKGGLWDVTPTIQNGSYVRDVMGDPNAKDTEWYLTKLQRTINQSTKTLLHSADNTYAVYRNSIDTLRQRMGDLRFRNKKEDVSGLWARDTHGAYSGDGVYSRYNRLQLGYDYAANEKSIYGFLFERGIGNPKYDNGNGKDHTFAGALYGTWLGDNGSYTDVVAKVGRDDTTLHSYGEWPDSASFRTREESLSVEYGRTHTLNKKGLFLEPEAQIVFGHLDSKDYTTGQGKTVHMDSYNSAIGRIGVLIGQRKTEGTHPFDYYAKVSVLHEFGGDRDFHLTAPDGETMDTSEDYRDTWYEAGFGGTYRINGTTYLYADGEREFGGQWNRKWQWNVGIHWQF